MKASDNMEEIPKIDLIVISLFDGLSGGHLALDRVPHLNVLRYYSSEIDKYAVQVANKNYPQDIPYRLGSIIDVDGTAILSEIRKEFGNAKILLIGGSPCQGFSMAGKLKGSSTKCGIDVTSLEQYSKLKNDGFEFDGQSYLFWEYVRIMYEVKPDYYLLENVRVTKKWLPMFNKAMGVEPILINSALLSAQNRQRYYWTNILNIGQPNDLGLVMSDILECGETGYGAAKRGRYKEDGTIVQQYEENGTQKSNALTTVAIRPCEPRPFNTSSTCHHAATAIDINGIDSIKRVYAPSGKSPTLTTSQGGHREPKVLVNKGTLYRKLTPLECERLQTLPDNYTDCVSNTQRRKMIGNSWTIDVVTHILKYIETKE